jgi:hypothetical protein
MNKSYVCVLFYFILSQIWLLKIQKDKKNAHPYIFLAPYWTMYGNLEPQIFFNFFNFLEFLQLFQQIVENLHPQKEEG